MRSEILKKILAEMDADPWHVKLKRWIKLKKWVFICKTRFIWDSTYSKYIFKKK